MMKENYQKQLEKILERPDIRGKKLLLHSCCAPCSSYVLEYLRKIFKITVFYYNPNITSAEEYHKRVEEEKRFICEYNRQNIGFPVSYMDGEYRPSDFFDAVRGLEDCREGGERCFSCYALRLRETANKARLGKYDFFATTLTISPLKNADKLNEIGKALEKEYGVLWLPSDFKKKNGYKRSIELSEEYGLYRQDYCGCCFSKAEREEQKAKRRRE